MVYRFALAVSVVMFSLAPAVAGKQTIVTLRDRQKAACADDAQRLCSAMIPDEDRVTVCMKAKKSQVSAKCLKMWNVTQ